MMRVVLSVALMLMIASGVSGCLNLSRPDAGGKFDAKGEYRCPGTSFRPITVDIVRRVMQRNGYGLHATEGSNCYQQDGAGIELSNVIFSGPYENVKAHERIVATQGHVNCTVRERPLYKDRAKVVSSTYAFWFELSYQNIGCGVTGSGAVATAAQIAKLKVAFREIVRSSSTSRSIKR
jgi:hypothetical protein